jgi:glutamate 5-kinase
LAPVRGFQAPVVAIGRQEQGQGDGASLQIVAESEGASARERSGAHCRSLQIVADPARGGVGRREMTSRAIDALTETAHRPAMPRPAPKTPALADFRRIVVKVGSSLLVDAAASRVREAWLASLAADIAALHREGRDILVVSSGAIALGRSVLKLPHAPLKLEDSQAAAAVGQISLARTWAEVLGAHGIGAGQILLTLGDTEERRRYLNARSTIDKLLEFRAVPVINENDTVATSEIRYGDNDRLAARVATMASADLLVLLSDVAGLYDAPPGENENAKLIPLVPRITAEIEAMAGEAGSQLSRGGMRTKIEAGKIATTAGTHMVIASGHIDNPLRSIADGGACTWFLTPANPVTARKKWIAGSLEPRGTITVDAGAVAALRRGKSLLPAGVIRVDGTFSRGDAVVVRGPDGAEIGRGLIAYDADDAVKIRGKSSGDILLILGFAGRAEMIHRDDLVLGSS